MRSAITSEPADSMSEPCWFRGEQKEPSNLRSAQIVKPQNCEVIVLNVFIFDIMPFTHSECDREWMEVLSSKICYTNTYFNIFRINILLCHQNSKPSHNGYLITAEFALLTMLNISFNSSKLLYVNKMWFINILWIL